jgi:carboxylesterase type B
LLLDVMVPQKIFDANPRKAAPVLVWIHGGGYTTGSKDQVNPTSLIARGLRDDKEGFVYVAINYRL